jgi:transglutaminase-like putative cysteine protease
MSEVALYNLGSAGEKFRFSVSAMKKMKDKYKIDPIIRRVAVAILGAANVPGRDFGTEAKALLEWVRDNIAFRRDATAIEVLQTPLETFAQRAGDCDCMALLLATLLESVGFRTRFMVSSRVPRGAWQHIYVQIQLWPSDNWMALDPTIPGARPGDQVPAARRAVV